MYNKPTTRIKICTDKSSDLIIGNDLYKIDNKSKIKVERCNDTLVIFANQDSLSKTYSLKPRNSFNYYGNVFSCGIGFIFDSKSNKRYTYQKNLYLDFHDDNLHRFRPDRKGQIGILFSIPYINSLFLKPYGEPDKLSIGFWGFNVGIEYFYRNSKSVRFTLSGASDLKVPLGSPAFSGEYELMKSLYISIINTYTIRDFFLGYGVNYSKNIWDLQYWPSDNISGPTRPPVLKSSQALGITLNGHYRIGEHFSIGLIYRPTFLQVKPTTDIVYEHLTSIDFAWKWPLRR
jgi:hypothetical protein